MKATATSLPPHILEEKRSAEFLFPTNDIVDVPKVTVSSLKVIVTVPKVTVGSLKVTVSPLIKGCSTKVGDEAILFPCPESTAP